MSTARVLRRVAGLEALPVLLADALPVHKRRKPCPRPHDYFHLLIQPALRSAELRVMPNPRRRVVAHYDRGGR